MIRLLLTVLTALFLTACSARIVRDASPASDLDAMAANAKRTLAPRTLPNGRLYCAELAKTEAEQDDCAGDLEDALYLSEHDKATGLASILRAIDRLRLSRNPCGFWARTFNRERCEVTP